MNSSSKPMYIKKLIEWLKLNKIDEIIWIVLVVFLLSRFENMSKEANETYELIWQVIEVDRQKENEISKQKKGLYFVDGYFYYFSATILGLQEYFSWAIKSWCLGLYWQDKMVLDINSLSFHFPHFCVCFIGHLYETYSLVSNKSLCKFMKKTDRE